MIIEDLRNIYILVVSISLLTILNMKFYVILLDLLLKFGKNKFYCKITSILYNAVL